MNTPWQAVWLLAGEVAGVVAITFIIVWRLRSVVWQRTLWQASLLAICGVLLMEFAALNQAPNPRPKPESQPLLSLSVPAAVQPVVEFKTEERSASTLESAELAIAPLPVDESQPALQEVQIEPVALTAKPGFETTPISREVATETEVKPIFPLALALAIGVWLIGVCVLAGRLLFGRALLLRFCSRSQLVADSALVKRVQGIALKLGLGEKIQVLETERIHTPVVFGLFQRGIALPKGFAQRFAREEQEAILAHELAHLSARDPLWYLLADTLVSLLWWHPLVWFARARLHVTSEMAADEACVLAENGPETLAQCLVSIAQEISPSGALESIGIEGSGFRSRLGQRVERLLKLSAEMVSRPAAWRTRMVKIGMPVLLVGVMVISSGWMRRDEANALKELPGMTWATLRTAIEIPPENSSKRERVPLPVAKSIELAQITNSLTPKIVSAEHDLAVQNVIQGTNRFTKIGRVDTNSFFKELEKKTGDKLDLKVEGNLGHYSYQSSNLHWLLKRYFESAGLNCEINEPDIGGVCVSFNPALGTLWVRGTSEEVGIARKLLQPFLIGTLPAPNPYVRTNTANLTTPQRQRILQKLDQVVIKELFFDGRTLPEVVLFLREESEKQDPEKKGVNFIINSNLIDQPKGTNALSEAVTNKVELEQMIVKVNPPLKNLTMAQALEAIVQVATPIGGYSLQYEVNDYAVVFRAELKKTPQMFTRAYKIDEKVFVKELESRVGDKVALMATNSTVSGSTNVLSGAAVGTNSNRLTEKLQAMARMYFVEQGVNLSTNGPGRAATQIFYNDRTGKLLVRAGLEDLGKIQAALDNLAAIEKVLPSPNSPVASTIVETNEVTKLVEEGRRLFESKKDDEAEAKFMEVMRLDPDNQAPHYYLNQIGQERLARKRDADQRIRMAGAPGTGSVTNKGGFLPVPNPYVRTQTPPAPSKALLRIEERLDNTVLKELFFDKLPLAEVVLFLMEESIKQDPEKRGVNFIINSKLDNQPGIRGETNAVMPDLEKVIITINPPLKNLTMREALTAITNATARLGGNSLAFSVNDYAVVFRQYIPEPPQMFVRRYKVDPDTFARGLKKVAVNSGLTNITTSTNLQEMTREFFRHVGLQMTTNTANATQMFYNDTNGTLLIRATLQDLEVAQQAIEVLNMGQAHVQIEAKYIEVPESVAQEMGLKWFTGSLSPATNLQMHGFINATIPTNGNVRVDSPVLPNHVSVLSTSQGKELLKQLEQKSGVNILASPRLTTLSQRQAQIAVGGALDIVTGKVPNTKEEYRVSKVVVGSTLDVVPFVSMDGYSVQLTWIYNLTEFKGFDRPSKDQDKDQPLPRFSVRQVGNTSVVRDGETLMFGAGVVEKVLEEGKRGGIFHTKPKTEKKHIIIMLTPTVVDPAGNPVNKRS